MDRRELMRMIALATGLSLAATGMSEAGGRGGGGGGGGGKAVGAEQGSGDKGKAADANPKGFERSGNPKAAGGPDNPGKGNPHGYHG